MRPMSFESWRQKSLSADAVRAGPIEIVKTASKKSKKRRVTGLGFPREVVILADCSHQIQGCAVGVIDSCRVGLLPSRP